MIHKRIDFTQNGGLPFTQDILNRMQDSYADISAAIAQLTDENMVLSGVKPSSSGWIAGWIVYNGELIPFAASKGIYLEFVEEKTALLFGDGVEKEVIVSKYARATDVGDGNSIRMNRLPAEIYQGVLQNGPFKRVRSFSEIYSNLGLFYNQINQLQPKYRAKQVNESSTLLAQYSFNIPASIYLDTNSDTVEANIYFLSGNSMLWVNNRILYISTDFEANTVVITTNGQTGIPNYTPEFIIVTIDVISKLYE